MIFFFFLFMLEFDEFEINFYLTAHDLMRSEKKLVRARRTQHEL